MSNETIKNTESTAKFISIKEATCISGLHPQTLRKFADTNQIKCYKTSGGQRKFNKQSLEDYCNNLHAITEKPTINKINYIYTRVSSKKQMEDLVRQLEFIRSINPKYDSYVSITDIASGINFKRKGLQTILDSCLQGTVGEIVIAHRDRLSRFGFELLNTIVRKCNGKITVINDEQNKSTEQELAEDLLSIVHIYSCRQMGKRRYEGKVKVKEN